MPISDLSKEQFEQYAKESNNWKELMSKCGYTNFGCRTYLKKKLELFDINISHFTSQSTNKKYSFEDIFKENSTYTTMKCIKNKLINQFNWKYECSSCKLSEWMGQKIPIEIDHINGIHTDNRIENLRFLCPNCHALTDTYKGRNIKNKEHSKEKYHQLSLNKICNNCNNNKHKNSEYCLKCHIELKLHKSFVKSQNKCVDCDKEIQNNSKRCVDCYKIAKKENRHQKEYINTNNMKNCPDCNKFISNKSLRCRVCHYNLMKLKSNTNSKEHIKGCCIDCNSKIDYKAIRCINCSNKIIENANKHISNIIHSRKVERPTYEQLIKDKESLSMVQIGKKYNVSDNTIRKWIKRYELEYKQ
jgi:hypothetical protein